MTKRIISIISCLVILFGLFTPNTAYASELVPYAILKTESEPNNLLTTANLVNQDDTITGYISSTSDVDFFKVVAKTNGILNFWLGNIPSGKDYDLYVYDFTGSLLGSSKDTNSTQELVSGIKAISGGTYYFSVRAKSGNYSTTNAYTVRCKLLMDPYSGFSQSSPTNSETFFSTTNLNKLYSNGSSTSWLARFKDAGCVMASYAMILRNLGATTAIRQYDFRSNTLGYLSADPFTVMLANTSWPTITKNSDGTYTASTNQDPVYSYHGRIANSFRKTANQVSLSGLSNSGKANAIAYYLSLHPEGVAVSFKNSAGTTHTIVFVQTTIEIPSTYSPPPSTVLQSSSYDVPSTISESDLFSIGTAAVSPYDNSFTVCDPAGTTYYGAPQSFGTSYAARNYGFSTAYKIVFFT